MKEQKEKIFGTDGIRGKVGEYPMTIDFAMRLASSIAKVMTPNGGKVAIGKDTRISGYMFESALESAFVAHGLEVILLGPLPSPAIAYYTIKQNCDFGIVISASHNSYEYNGIKIINHQGEKIDREIESIIESKLSDTPITNTAETLGKAKISNTSRSLYKSLLMSLFADIDHHLPLKGFKIVVDASNGAAYKIAPQVLLDLGADVIPIACSPNGKNINLDCGSSHPETLRKTVVATDSNLGIALDGDADRILIVDEKGNILDGDQILYILAKANISNKSFNHKVVGTITTNSGLEMKLRDMNIDLYRSDVGDKNVYSMMKKTGAIIGGESSGHIINSEYSPTGDALLIALIIIKESLTKELKISELVSDLELLPVLNENIDTENLLHTNENFLSDLANEVNSKNPEGRVIIRPSGTEPLIRISIENKDQDVASILSKEIINTIKENG
ncbi:MAG: phosphoglucosamine mutase [Gammaproteobacteria bacterium]|nr:phosphoglucosamine mutase [Gammaproteobacteria bacterium]HAH67424.1 phosphoglucosamine mutase [Gammaproteobacteria bacterium]|tara:strand:+ start:3131 stop:4474 length:1344 start_codon:yes stop_codon:yes gene_type:complete